MISSNCGGDSGCRDARPDDRAAVSRVYEESWKAAYRGIIPQNFLDSIPSGGWANVDQPGWRSIVLLEAGQIIGTSSYSSPRFPEMVGGGEIISLYLLPEFWGKGYGKPLLETALDGLAEMGYGRAFLWVLEENLRARRFYEKNGFVPDGAVRQDEIGGKPLRELLYRRSVLYTLSIPPNADIALLR